MTASAPIFPFFLLKQLEGTTGITLMLCSLKRAMYLAGLLHLSLRQEPVLHKPNRQFHRQR